MAYKEANGIEDIELVNHTKVIFNTKNLIMVLSSLLMSPCLNFKSFKSYSSLLYMSFIMMNIYSKMKICKISTRKMHVIYWELDQLESRECPKLASQGYDNLWFIKKFTNLHLCWDYFKEKTRLSFSPTISCQ